MVTAPVATASTAFRHIAPAFRTFAGPDVLEDLRRETRRAGAERLLVVTSPSVASTLPFSGLLDTLGSSAVATFSRVAPHSPVQQVLEAVELMRQHRVDGLVAVGGGSAVVTARAAAIIHGEGRPVTELCTHRDSDGKLVSPRLTQPKVPIWIVPTTPTTAYAKVGAAVREDVSHERLALFAPDTRAAGLFLHPGLAMTAPPSLVRSASLNAFSMVIESLQANLRDPVADGLLLHAATLVRENLPRLDEDESSDARLQLMTAAMLSGIGTDAAGGGLAQALAHALGPRSGVANGVIEATLLPAAIRYNDVDHPERITRLHQAIGASSASPSSSTAAEGIERLLTRWDVPACLRDLGIQPSSLKPAADAAVGDWALTQAPRPATASDLIQLLDDAW